MLKKKYEITKSFTSGNLKGLTIKENTDVYFKIGFVSEGSFGGSDYKIIDVKEKM